jgi:hypothetical protein
VARLIDGTAPHPRPLEDAIVVLARKSYEAPARLDPADLDALRALVGDGALDYALVVSAFHFINRIADLLHVDPEALPAPLRRVEPLRRVGVWVASLLMRRMDLANRPFTASYDDAVAAVAPLVEPHTGRPVGEAFASLRARPKIIETLRLAMEERDRRSTLDRPTLARVHDAVEAALPTCLEETDGFHARPRDPVEAFAFVGTRYAYRTTTDMIDALRGAGYDDLGILDLAIAVADANQWARNYRLFGAAPALYYVRPPAGAAARA